MNSFCNLKYYWWAASAILCCLLWAPGLVLTLPLSPAVCAVPWEFCRVEWWAVTAGLESVWQRGVMSILTAHVCVELRRSRQKTLSAGHGVGFRKGFVCKGPYLHWNLMKNEFLFFGFPHWVSISQRCLVVVSCRVNKCSSPCALRAGFFCLLICVFKGCNV